MSNEDFLAYLQKAFELAAFALGKSDPNPSVGALLYHPQHGIIGGGFTQAAGGLHAEKVAIAQALLHYDEKNLQDCIFYVTLEPCSHQGKTPPCTETILQKKIPQVSFVCHDINPLVSGYKTLQDKGVRIVIPPEKNFAREIFWTLGGFLSSWQNKKARVFLKWAQSRDGFLAPAGAKRQNISNESAKEIVYRLRSFLKAVLVTPSTVNIDRPRLDARWQKKTKLYLKDMQAKNKSSAYLLSLLHSIENNPPAYVDKKWRYDGVCQRYFMIPSYWSEDECEEYAQRQKKLGDEFFFLFTHTELFNALRKKGYACHLLDDFADLESVQKIVFAGGALQLLVEAGPSYAEKYLQSGNVNSLIVFRSPRPLNEDAEKGIGTSVSLDFENILQNKNFKIEQHTYKLQEQMYVFADKTEVPDEMYVFSKE